MAHARRTFICGPALLTGAVLLAACSDSSTPTSSDSRNSPNFPKPPNVNPAPSPVPLGSALAGLMPFEAAQFARGQAVFVRVFTPATGLGPLFNNTSCAGCHDDPVTGGYSDDDFETHATAYHRGSCNMLASEGGPVFESHVTPAVTALTGLTAAPVPKDATGTGIRFTPDVFGRGLIEAIPDQTLRQLAWQERSNPDHIAGRANILANGHVGRFGRKANVDNLRDFNATAFLKEMGITSSLDPQEPLIIAGKTLPASIEPGGIDLSDKDLNDATAFTRLLAPPPLQAQTAQTNTGSMLFDKVGCAGCHVRSLKTGSNAASPSLSNRTVGLFSDLLLHDMGPALADICFLSANPSEFRTEPLMGVNHREEFMHDHKSTTIDDAIQRHGGQGSAARARFRALSPAQQAALTAYVNTL
ncbi:MAG TPA: di-heme oxidoredictase family protein [Gemmatimonadaceae bacterium]|nr:di-heme oxidoredictase family protein [Gemmatimonadaceae bacterium]